jgi:putative ABC transport system ATP-binding protein
MVMVTHDAKAATIADRVLFLAAGLIVRDLGCANEEQIMETVKEVTLT